MKSTLMSLTVMVALIFAGSYQLLAENPVYDFSFSTVDGVYFYEPGIDCDELKNSEECETFKAVESYSMRDGVSYSDCSIECDDLFESDACFSFRQTYPCPVEPDSLLVVMRAMTKHSEL